MIGDIWRDHAGEVASLSDLLDDIEIELDDLAKAEGLRHLTRVL